MHNFTVHSIDTASDPAKPLLEGSIKDFGMIPNLHGVMAESPQLLEAYKLLHSLAQQTSFSKEELTVVWQSINVEHACHYCVPAHTAIANMMNVDPDISEALRNNSPLPSNKLEVLRTTTLAVLRNRGVVSDADLDNFYHAGYSNKQLLEIILVLSQKVLSNYVNHIADTPVDEPFKAFSWKK